MTDYIPILKFNEVNANGRLYSKDCKISIPEHFVPIIHTSSDNYAELAEGFYDLNECVGSANVQKKEDGLYLSDIKFIDTPHRQSIQPIIEALIKSGTNIQIVPAGTCTSTRQENDVTIIEDFKLHTVFFTTNPSQPLDQKEMINEYLNKE